MHIILEPCGTQQVKFDRCTRVQGASGQSTGGVVIGNGQEGTPGRGVGDQNWHRNQRYGNMWEGLGGLRKNPSTEGRTEVNARPSSQQLCRSCTRSAWRLLSLDAGKEGRRSRQAAQLDGNMSRHQRQGPRKTSADISTCGRYGTTQIPRPKRKLIWSRQSALCVWDGRSEENPLFARGASRPFLAWFWSDASEFVAPTVPIFFSPGQWSLAEGVTVLTISSLG